MLTLPDLATRSTSRASLLNFCHLQRTEPTYSHNSSPKTLLLQRPEPMNPAFQKKIVGFSYQTSAQEINLVSYMKDAFEKVRSSRTEHSHFRLAQ